MNILICAGYYSNNANSKIGSTIATELKYKGISVEIAYIDDSVDKTLVFTKLNIKSYRINSILDDKTKHDRLKKYSSYTKQIKKLFLMNSYDYVISISAPFYQTFRLYKELKTKGFVYYQLDPFGIHESNSKIKTFFNQIIETRLIKGSYLTITTFPLYQEYLTNKKYKKYSHKLLPLNFPNFDINNYKSSTKSNNSIVINYFGSIDDSYRNPKSIMEFILSSKLNPTINLFGNISSSIICNLKEKYSDRINIMGAIPFEEASKKMNENSFLLNINNSIKNQYASKLIDYISTGNPIINVVKHKNDITPKMLDQYQYVFNYYEYKTNDIEKFNNFLISNLNKKVRKDVLIKLYYTYAPNYITNQILNFLKDDANDLQ